MQTKRPLIMIALAGLLGTTSSLVLARAGGGAGTHSAGGVSAGHMSSQGAQNTNGPNASDREKGLDRADVRMSEQGLENSKARTATRQGKRKAQAEAKVTGGR